MGIFLFYDRNYVANFPHRRDIAPFTYTAIETITSKILLHTVYFQLQYFSELKLQIPSTDDYGNYFNATFHKIWWGHLDPDFLRLPSDLEVKRFIHLATQL